MPYAGPRNDHEDGDIIIATDNSKEENEKIMGALLFGSFILEFYLLELQMENESLLNNVTPGCALPLVLRFAPFSVNVCNEI